VSGFQKVALPLGILVVMSAIAGLVGNHFSHELKGWHEVKAITLPLPPPIYGGYLIDAGGVRLHVPIGYFGSIFPNGRDVVLIAVRGNSSPEMYDQEKARDGIMNFWFQNETMSRMGAERMREWVSQRFTEKSFHIASEQARSLAGQDGVCSEYSIRYGGEVMYGTRLGIACTFGKDEYATFEGTPPSAADFYQVIESAQPLKGKN
jgi:hypothetical protein